MGTVARSVAIGLRIDAGAHVPATGCAASARSDIPTGVGAAALAVPRFEDRTARGQHEKGEGKTEVRRRGGRSVHRDSSP
jgi:hypothetical protein